MFNVHVQNLSTTKNNLPATYPVEHNVYKIKTLIYRYSFIYVFLQRHFGRFHFDIVLVGLRYIEKQCYYTNIKSHNIE